jgi:SAM-dependent methyltransferase
MNAYDHLRYNNLPAWQTHPSRLFALGRLAGLEPPRVETCRVLEIGTSEAANIIGMAVALPRANFVGIDLAAEPIARGRRIVEQLGLKHVRLEVRDLREIGQEFGTFDYILAHGIYGWTPGEVGEKLFAIARDCLSPNGIIFISYNAQPAGHIRRMVREMLLYHAGRFEDAAEKLRHARAFLALLAAGRPEPEAFDYAASSYADTLLHHSDSALFHDDLAPVYEPVYFHEFAARAAAHGLHYVGDAGGYDEPRNIKPEVLEAGRKLAAGDRIAEEQYLDFLRMRGFRQSLLTRAEIPAAAAWTSERAVGLYAFTSASETEDGAFIGLANVRLTTTHPVPIAYMRKLIEARPYAVRVTEPDAEVALALFKTGIIELHGSPGSAARPGERPAASPLARLQARTGEPLVTTLWHRALEVEGDESRRILELLDGTRTRAEIAGAMNCSTEYLEQQLTVIARLGLLVG